MKDQKAQSDFELTDAKMSLNMQLAAVEQLTNKLKITKEANEAETAAKSVEIDELKKGQLTDRVIVTIIVPLLDDRLEKILMDP